MRCFGLLLRLCDEFCIAFSKVIRRKPKRPTLCMPIVALALRFPVPSTAASPDEPFFNSSGSMFGDDFFRSGFGASGFESRAGAGGGGSMSSRTQRSTRVGPDGVRRTMTRTERTVVNPDGSTDTQVTSLCGLLVLCSAVEALSVRVNVIRACPYSLALESYDAACRVTLDEVRAAVRRRCSLLV